MKYCQPNPGFGVRPIHVIVLFGASLSPTLAFAYFPFFTDDTGTQGRGGHQIELDYAWNRDQGDEIDEDSRVIGSTAATSQNLPVTYTYGLVNSMDVFVGAARQTSPSGGWQSSQFGLKWVFWGDQEQGWSAAFKPTLTTPVTQAMQVNGLGSAKWNAALTLIASRIEEHYEIHINAGYQSNRLVQLPGDDPQRQNLFNISIAPVAVINDDWKVGLDIGLQTNPGFDSSYQLNAGIGAVYFPMPNVQLGFGVFAVPSLGGSTRQIGYAVTTGLTVQF